MGLTTVELSIAPIEDRKNIQSAEFLVDSGARYTVLPTTLWKALGIEAESTVRIQLADGTIDRRPVGYAWVTYEGRTVPNKVILGEPDDSSLLGVVTLEEMGLMIDPIKRTLKSFDARM